MSAIPVLQPIEQRCLRKPDYDNRHLRDFGRWYATNEPRLSQYFDELCRVEPEGCDFFEFAAMQHEREEIIARGAA